MSLISNDTRKAMNLVIPFGISGWVFYDTYSKKGQGDWKGAAIIAVVVFACCYIVTTQVSRLLVPESER